MTVVLALDLGTTSTAAVAVNGHGEQIHTVRRDHASDITGLPFGHAEQCPQKHLRTAIAVLRQVSQQLTGSPLCLSLTGQMHSALAVDTQRQPLGNLITWQDRRANQQCGPTIKTYLDELLSRCPADAVADSGCRLSPGYGAVSLFVLREQLRLPRDIAGISTLADWITAEFTDGPLQIAPSNAAALGIYDLRRNCWSESLAEACSVQQNWLPTVVPGGEPVGKLCASIAAETGLPQGLPVCAAIGDNQASVLGSVPQGEPAIQITVGTGGQVNWPIESFARVDDMDTRPLPPERMMLVGAGLAGGDAYAWVNRLARQWLRAFGAEFDTDSVYQVLCGLAGEIADDADGLVCEPSFRGTRREPLRKGTFSGISPDNFSPGHLARAVLTGIAAGFHGFWSSAGNNRPPDVSRIIGCGNGLQQNPLLARIIADTFSLPVAIPRHTEAAAYGAALLAGVRIGLWPNLSEAGRAINLTTVGDASNSSRRPIQKEAE